MKPLRNIALARRRSLTRSGCEITDGRWFRNAFQALPAQVQYQARAAYRLFCQNPYHPSLHFKQIHPIKPIYSVRISLDYRALGVRENDEIIWFWIGSHAEYDKILDRGYPLPKKRSGKKECQ